MFLSKNYFDQVNNAVTEFQNATVPIFTIKYSTEGKRKTLYVGSSFYVKYKTQFFIITANHVFLEAQPLFVPVSSTQSETLQYDRQASLKNVNYDLIVLRLINPIKETRFIPYELCETELDDNFLEPRQYIAFGFPGSKVRFYEGKLNGHLKLFFSTKEDVQEYKRLDKNENDYLLLKFDKKDVIENGVRKIFCNPNGMSGGCVISLDSEMIIPIRFEGILIEWDVEKKKTMIAIRKQYVKYLLEQINKSEK